MNFISILLLPALLLAGIIPEINPNLGLEPETLSSAGVKSVEMWTEIQRYDRIKSCYHSVREFSGKYYFNEQGKILAMEGIDSYYPDKIFIVYTYNSKGLLTRNDIYSAVDSTLYQSLVWEYDSLGRNIQFLNYFNADTIPDKYESCKTSYITDSDGNITEQKEDYFNGEIKTRKKFYNQSGFLVKEVYSNSAFIDTVKYEYNSQGYLVHKTGLRDWTSYYYDSLNRLKESINRDRKTTIKSIYRYGPSGRLLQYFELDSSNIKQYERNWEYNEYNLLSYYSSNDYKRDSIMVRDYPRPSVNIEALPKFANDTVLVWGKKIIPPAPIKDTILYESKKIPDKYFFEYEYFPKKK